MVQKGAVAARERARLAKVKRYAEQVARQAQVEDKVTEYYLASDAFDAAQDAAAVARARMATLVEMLITDLQEPVSGAAVLCGITPAQVRALRKEAGSPSTTASTTTSGVAVPTEKSDGEANEDATVQRRAS